SPTDADGNNVYNVTVQVSDGSLTDSQAIAVTVTNVNEAPVANAQSVSTAEDTAKAITLTGTDADGDTLTYSVVAGPSHGTLSGSAPALTYTPAANYNGPDSFTFKANDGTADSNIATISITVTPINTQPVITSNGGGATASISVPENTTAVTTVTATYVDGDTLTYSISGGADAAFFSINDSTGVLTFITAPDFENPADSGANNTYEVIVQVSDGTLTDTQTITVTVTDVVDTYTMFLPVIKR
ncbi:MAG TPA: Ig-like domain-containing protein, partial [Anaerolineaceae bacterium]